MEKSLQGQVTIVTGVSRSQGIGASISRKIAPLGSPEDAAQLVAFLISSEADWIAGQTIRSRGGFY